MANAHAGRSPAPDHIVDANLVLNRDQAHNELANISHRELVVQTQENIIEWLARHGLLHNQYMCPNCNVFCRLGARNDRIDSKRWICRSCNFTKSIRADSFFEDSKLTLNQIIDFIYFWSKKLLLSYVMEETGMKIGILPWIGQISFEIFVDIGMNYICLQ